MDRLNAQDKRFYLSRKLIGVVTFFIIAASVLVVLTNFSINMIAASGDYMRILSAWSQHYHQSSASLEQYARTGKHADYLAFKEAKNQLQEKQTVIDEFFKANPNTELIFDAFVTNKVYPNEISSLLFAFQQFDDSENVQKIRRQWERLNTITVRQRQIQQKIQRKGGSSPPDIGKVNLLVDKIHQLNNRWHAQYQQLMAEVGNSAMLIKRAGLWTSVILGILLVLIGVVIAVRANKSIGRWEQNLHEKEILLSEIHHRVKNNMAVISGLLELESIQDGDPEQALRESRDRIQSMAMIHEILYQSDSFSEINLGTYLQKLSKNITDMYADSGKDTNLKAELDDVVLNINQAVPVGLIVNEVITNAFEHGFEFSNDGTICLKLQERDRQIFISIKDNGKGLPQDFNYETDEASGLMIVETLVQQLDGNVQFANGEDKEGVSFEFNFKKSNSSGSRNANL